MTFNPLILFCIIPLAAGLLCMLLVRQPGLSRMVGVVSMTLNLVFSVALLMVSYLKGPGLIFTTDVGGWPAPYGITLVFDSLAGLLLAPASLVALACYIHSFSSLKPETERRYFHPLAQLLMFGVNLSFLTGDLFNLFVAFEIMLMASYALLSIGGTRRQLTQSYKYVVLNLMASTVFVASAGMVYGMFGTLNIAHLTAIVRHNVESGTPLPTGFTALAVLLLLVFGLKGAFFPLWFWLPDTYYTCPIALGAWFGGTLTKVGVYAVARLFPFAFAQGEGGLAVIMPIIAISAAFTMFLGVLGAVSQHEVRRILAIHVISQVGYMVFGIAVMTPLALAGCVFYMIQHMIVKASLFLCCGVMERHAGTDDLDHMGGMLKKHVWLGVLFLVAALSLVGLPPLSGFFGKLTIIREGWESHPWLSVIGLATGALTLLSMMKIFSYAFWSPEPKHAPPKSNEDIPTDPNRSWVAAYVGIVMLVVAAVGVGVGAEPVFRIALVAGHQMHDPTDYIKAVAPNGVPGVHTVATKSAVHHTTTIPAGEPNESPIIDPTAVYHELTNTAALIGRTSP